jgi:Skp family chaperone for outer membrane proteins
MNPRFSMFLCLIAALIPSAPAAAQTQPTRVAIANPARIFQEIQETKDLKQAMENKGKTLGDQKFAKEAKIKDLQANRDQLRPDAPQYADRNRELLAATMEYQVWMQMSQADMQSEQKRQMLNLFNKIQAAVQKVAAARGIDLVVSAHNPEFPENIDQLNVDQVRQIINSRNVLFVKPELDISNDVIAEMDKAYKAGR